MAGPCDGDIPQRGHGGAVDRHDDVTHLPRGSFTPGLRLRKTPWHSFASREILHDNTRAESWTEQSCYFVSGDNLHQDVRGDM